jgi:hypothetical protein
MAAKHKAPPKKKAAGPAKRAPMAKKKVPMKKLPPMPPGMMPGLGGTMGP